jgi:glycosyltransferase involved in cell wall biosynthesis
MKLSIVIPAYNEENYIGSCLEAVSRAIKGRADIEVIVVNNASVDGTRGVIERYPFARIVDEPQKGLARARKAGYLVSSGELIANVDADTWISRRWINRVLFEFNRDPQLVALSGPFVYVDLPKFYRVLVSIWYRIGWAIHVVGQVFFRHGAILQGGNFVVRRSALESIGGYNEAFTFYGEDTDIANRIQQVGRVKFTFQLPMRTSGRRLLKGGVFWTGFEYAVNYFWGIVFKKPFTKSETDFR